MSASSASGGVRLSTEQKLAWLRLIRTENVGPATFRAMINHYGSASAALAALPEVTRRAGGRLPRIPTADDAAAELDRIERHGATLVALGEPDYPARLREIASAPPLISVRGDLSVLLRPMVAIVGSRNASVAGCRMAERIASGLGERGYVVVSGLARGIDGSAHRASLATGTIAVIAGGIDHVYPEEHGPLLEAIVDRGGAVLTEMPFGWIPRAQDFPRRNRIVSGLSLGVVVVEAASRSGTLHTARFALEQNREVFAVPGSPLDSRADGTNDLIRKGATLVRNADDIVEVLDPLIRTLPLPGLDVEEPGVGDERPFIVDDRARQSVVSALSPVPTALDDIALHTGLPVRTIVTIVTDLEIEGRIERHGAGLVSLIR